MTYWAENYFIMTNVPIDGRQTIEMFSNKENRDLVFGFKNNDIDSELLSLTPVAKLLALGSSLNTLALKPSKQDCF